MSTLPTRSQQTIVATIAAGMQGRIDAFLNFSVGRVLRAMAEAYGGVCLWLQAVALQTAKLTRLATSFGTDADSFVADFPLAGTTRLGAQPSTGTVIYGRFTAASSAPVIPVGAISQTGDGSQRFVVYADAANGAYSEELGGYVMAPQTTTVIVPAQAVVAGSAGNVAAGAINLPVTSISGVSTVTNPAAFTNGIDFEDDASLKSRFQLAVRGRGGGTAASIQSAIANLRVGLTCVIMQGHNLDGSTNPGMVSVIVDDGSGNLSADLLAVAQTAVADNASGVRAAGIRVGVYPAVAAYANVVMQIIVATGYYRPTVVAQVEAAIALYINGLGQGASLEYFDLPAVAKTVPGCLGVVSSTYTLNGGTVDLVGTPQTTYKAASLVIS